MSVNIRELNVPRCATCAHYQKIDLVMACDNLRDHDDYPVRMRPVDYCSWHSDIDESTE
jgi:hypothetical protein